MILPFPGGMARSGSKVGSKYKAPARARTPRIAPTLRGVVPTEMPPEARCAYEIVIDGLTPGSRRASHGGRPARGQRSRRNLVLGSPPATMAASSGRFTFGCMMCSVDIRQMVRLIEPM